MTPNEKMENPIAVLMNEMILKFGGKDYRVPKLAIRPTKRWMTDWLNSDKELSKTIINGLRDTPELATDLVVNSGVDNVISAILSYVGSNSSLTRETIQTEATPNELETAFDQLLSESGFFTLVKGKSRRMEAMS